MLAPMRSSNSASNVASGPLQTLVFASPMSAIGGKTKRGNTIDWIGFTGRAPRHRGARFGALDCVKVPRAIRKILNFIPCPSWENIMTAPRLLVFSAIAFIASVSASYAGPCTDDIDKMQARIDAKLQAMAAAGPTGRQVGASHVQPTSRSIVLPRKNLARCRLKRLRLSDSHVACARRR